MTSKNKALETYIPIANLIAQTFGKNCEVVLHDLSIPQNSVVYTVNNHVTGRQVGQPFEHLIKDVLLSKNFENDCTANYRTTTIAGKKIKSSTALLRDVKGEVIGALCVNYDLSPLNDMKILLDEFMDTQQEKIEANVEPFDNVIEIVEDLINKMIGNSSVTTLKRKDKIELIQFMDKKGVFLIKGAIEKVAEKLNISKVTVYSYLDAIKKSENE
ncbi:Predicted transcriptional regulator YheO, contains PAS and DNA-binding HTH domains [Propionispira arboris]|uniref:Predicted transcriptional regulator YheO, contains PAS and DNA-binding HTH domains n=1 Tax=Propionispira arboris TaxID=84035 RepID=A0A1H6VBJ5_9FIRM|nr:PAS domain-containing protein [Propionispira arboris]SEJ01206.1 Predicted transcriptional regulator YheO, contains PAS and DNA-binding HTH domains [Propionispira arboris]